MRSSTVTQYSVNMTKKKYIHKLSTIRLPEQDVHNDNIS